MIPSLRERDGKLIENWYVACLSRELGQKTPLARRIYDTPLVVFRDESGQARALPDRCLHRHAKLSEGTLENGRLRCPYHGWTYDREGSVVEIPSEGPHPTTTKSRPCLQPLRSIEQDGCIWVWMGAQLPGAPPPFRFPSSERPDWISYFMVTDFENEVTHLAENFMDVPHTVFVHRGWFRRRSMKQVPIRVEAANASVLVTYNQPQDAIGFTRWILNPGNQPMTHTDRFISPNITRVDYDYNQRSGFIITSQITPISTLKSRVYTQITYRLAGPRVLGKLLEPFLRFYTRRVIQQDVEIMQNQGSNFREDMSNRFHGTDADVVHIAIERQRALGISADPALQTWSQTWEKTIWI
jgi:phenylpropionate dioxygenase-like ring-hydroxylating dioxygenase large terminal subunit